MEYNIRNYTPKDLPMLQHWCQAYDEVAPVEQGISETSYILEIDNLPALFISLIFTNTKIAFLENYCGNPEFKGKRLEAVQYLIQHLEKTAKDNGYIALVTFAYKEKLVKQFEAYGFIRAVDNLTAFVRGIN